MQTRLIAIVSLLLFGSASAATLDGCQLLTSTELERLGVPKDSTATPKGSEKEGKYLCSYALKGTISLTVTFGKANKEISQATEERTARAKTTASSVDSRSTFDAAFDESSSCGSSAVTNGQVVVCWGIKNNIILDFLVVHPALGDPKKVPAAPYLQVFNDVLSRVSTWKL